MTDTYDFNDLTTLAQIKALTDYVKNHQTKEKRITLKEALEACNDSEILYTKSGKYSQLNYEKDFPMCFSDSKYLNDD